MDNTYNMRILESMLGTTVSMSAGVQIMVNPNLPLKNIHYELYNNHVELHVEDRNDTYKTLCSFLKDNLPNNDIAQTEKRGFCVYAYVLIRRVEGLNDIEELGKAIIELRSIVNPVLERHFEQMAENLRLAEAFGEYYEKQKTALPFHINVIDELHADENAHSRILMQLLKYKEDGKQVFLSSFLKQLPNFNIDDFDIEKSETHYNKEYIDCLIEKKGEFAVIIENKIHWAKDQDRQIERYITTEIKNGIPADNIWVIYLTRDGRKKVESYSYTDKAKEILQDGHFIEMDYRHDILPWLKEHILPNCRLKEEWLISAIKQYIDHLEGLFDIRENQTDFRQKMQNHIAKGIGCTETMSRSEFYTKLQSYKNILGELQNIVNNSIEDLISPIINHFEDTTKEIIGELCPNDEYSFNKAIHYSFFQILFKKWISQVHFEWYPLDEKQLLYGKEYTFALHVENNDIEYRFKEVINSRELGDKAKNVGLEIDKEDHRVFYKKVINTQKPIANMTHEELTDFLCETYKNINDVQMFVTNHILNER